MQYGMTLALSLGSDHEITGKEIENMKTTKHILALSAAVLLFLGASSAIAQNGQGTVDANDDGICDVTGKVIGSGVGNARGQQARRGNANGLGNGAGNQGNGPKDGTGYGAQSGNRTGPQDGSQARIRQGNSTGSGSLATGNRARKRGR